MYSISNQEVKVLLFDVFHASVAVWCPALLSYLLAHGIQGPLLHQLLHFLHANEQRVCLDGIVFDALPREADIPPKVVP